MANAILAAPNRIEAATLSGGDWLAGSRPNLASRPYGQAAQSNGLNPTATQFTLTLDQPRSLRVLALLAHNLGSLAQVRWRVSLDAAFSQSVFDSGWSPVWPALPTPDMRWSDANWWSGTLDEERRAFYPRHHFTVLPDERLGAFVRCELNDPSNPDGAIKIGRAGVYDGWQPIINFSYGAKLGHETSERIVKSEAGLPYSSGGNVGRVAQIAFEHLSATEARAMMDLERRLGLAGELIYIADPADPGSFTHQAFPARLRELSPIDWVGFDTRQKSFLLEELIQGSGT
ncbi:hypothetical protein [Parachitinimonas caeni]|uniref:Uncharacterized protein n=1 Tax=Parachitinimonas caeni TaxID=3031301 RepID=A0ABT7DRC1_9NEIS|nr:hypothetical protein [Parachitinimonas caeni]MDK2122606.1 hypothetical protein [Parachitinimonas caeni]